MESIADKSPTARSDEGIVSPNTSRRDSKRTWGPYTEPSTNAENVVSEEVQERLAKTVIGYLEKNQANFEQRIVTIRAQEQSKRDAEHNVLLEQLQALHVELGRTNWEQNAIKAKIEETVTSIESRQKWLFQQMGNVTDKVDWYSTNLENVTEKVDWYSSNLDANMTDLNIEPLPQVVENVNQPTTATAVSGEPNMFPDFDFYYPPDHGSKNVMDVPGGEKTFVNPIQRASASSTVDVLDSRFFPECPVIKEQPVSSPKGIMNMVSNPIYPMPMSGLSSERMPPPRIVSANANWQLHKISPVTRFDARNLDGWIREVRYWRELYYHLDDDQMLASLGLNNTDDIKSLMMDFLDETKLCREKRSVEHFLARVTTEFGAERDVVRMERLQNFMNFRRKSDWDIRTFWRKCKEILRYLKQAGVDLDDRVSFTQILTALQMTSAQRHLVLTSFESRAIEKSVLNLQNITVKLFGSYNTMPQETFVSGGAGVEDGEDSDASAEEALLAKRAFKKKGKAGMDVTAVRRTTVNTGMANGKGILNTGEVEHALENTTNRVQKTNGPLCLRCQSPDHFWRQCPMPFRKDLNFGGNPQNVTPKPKFANRSKDDLKRTLLTMAEDIMLENESLEKAYAVDHDDGPNTHDVEEPSEEEKVHLCWVSSIYRVQVREGSNVSTCVVIDSGASSTVCSKEFLHGLNPNVWKNRRESDKKFRFGDSRCFPSLGLICIVGLLTLKTDKGMVCEKIHIQCDVVEAKIPVLISRPALVRMHAVIHFDQNILVIGGRGTVKLQTSSSGHLLLPLILDANTNVTPEDWDQKCYPASTRKVLDSQELVKVHKQLGHANVRQLSSVLREAGYEVNRVEIESMIDNCGCRGSRTKSYACLANAHLAPYPGYAVFVDIIYLRKTGHQDPYVMIIDSFSRFIVCVPTPSIKPRDIVQIFEIFWMHWLGRPRFLVRDSGPGLVGNDWNAYARIHDITLICNPTNTPEQMGVLERHVALLKVAIEGLQEHDSKLEFAEVVRAACLARNNSILIGCGVTPSQICFGKNDYLNVLERGGDQSLEKLNTEEARLHSHVVGVMKARSIIMQADAERTIQTCLKHNIRPGCDKVPEIGSSVDVVRDHHWIPGWRMVGMIGSNVVVEQDNRIIKLPLTKVRSSEPKLWLSSKKKDLASSSSKDICHGVDEQVLAVLDERYWLGPRETSVENCMHGSKMGYFGMNHGFSIFSSHGLFSGCTDDGFLDVFESKAKKIKDMEQDLSEDDFDPSRLPPRVYLKDKLCVEAIIAELEGLLKNDSQGRSALMVVNRLDPQYKNWPLVRSTLVVRWKGPLRAKARLCIRGDLMPIRDPVSAPTPFRSSMKIFLAISAACGFSIVSMDISQAFIQADELNPRDQLLLSPPDCITLPWNHTVDTIPQKTRRLSPWVFRVLRPLYGMRESPLRWFIHISTSIRRFGFKQHRSDICVFSRRRGPVLLSLLLLYVDDILFAYASDSELQNFKNLLAEYRTGNLERLTLDSSITFFLDWT